MTPRQEIKKVLRFIAQNHRMTYDEMMKTGWRYAPLVKARQEAMRCLKSEFELSYSQIATMFNVDHTTVVHAVHRYKHLEKRWTKLERLAA